MNKIALQEPVKLTLEQIWDISNYVIVTTDSKWLVTELESDNLFKLSTALDILTTNILENE